MPITYKHGDIFLENVDAIVNTVNCVGVMGKGVALQFKKYSTENFKEYKKLCDAKKLAPGNMFIFDLGNDLLNPKKPRYLINFPTKNHWREKSKFSYIEEGLDDFIVQIQEHEITSVAMPALGCGNGGLPWDDVQKIIHDKLADIDDIDFIVIPPRDAVIPPEYAGPTHKMTYERALLLKIIGEFETYFGGYLTHMSLQEIVYFLQALGVNYTMDFDLRSFGPYSEKLAKIFERMDQQKYIDGFNDGEVQVTSTAFSEANSYLNDNPQNSDKVIKSLSQLVDGFESPYGMELLASTHYTASHGNSDFNFIMSQIAEWKGAEQNGYQENVVRQAYDRLLEDGLLAN